MWDSWTTIGRLVLFPALAAMLAAGRCAGAGTIAAIIRIEIVGKYFKRS